MTEYEFWQHVDTGAVSAVRLEGEDDDRSVTGVKRDLSPELCNPALLKRFRYDTSPGALAPFGQGRASYRRYQLQFGGQKATSPSNAREYVAAIDIHECLRAAATAVRRARYVVLARPELTDWVEEKLPDQWGALFAGHGGREGVDVAQAMEILARDIERYR